jgi:hypothetical protein
MAAYCLNRDTCRRNIIAEHFLGNQDHIKLSNYIILILIIKKKVAEYLAM